MKQKVAMLLCLMTAWCISAMAQTQPSGSGTQASPYQVSNAQELLWVAGLANGTLADVEQNKDFYAEQTANIDLSTVCGTTRGSWTPIAYGGDNPYFAGVYDGNGHTISNLYIDTNDELESIGLFGIVTGRVCNLNLIGVNINAPQSHFVGAVAGTVNGDNDHDLPNMENITVAGSVIGADKVGGIVGQGYLPYGCEIVNCKNTAGITGNYFVGGIAGNATTIRLCTNTGDVTAHTYLGGGIVGSCISINDCFNRGVIRGATVGGICGTVSNELSSVFTIGNVNGTNSQCGIIAAALNTYNVSGSQRIYSTSARLSLNNSRVSLANTTAYYDYYTNANTNNYTLTYTLDEIKTGVAAFILQDERAETVWEQRLGVAGLPQIGTTYRVYASGDINCLHVPSGDMTYSNTEATATVLPHEYTDGACTICGAFEEPEQSGDRYLIKTPAHLGWLQDYLKTKPGEIKVLLMNDIDMAPFRATEAGRRWNALANGNCYFEGEFDGNDHVISGVDWHLFVNVRDANIHDLKVVMSGSCGAMISSASRTTITNCIVLGTINAYSYNSMYTCGLVGRAVGCTITDCANYASIYSVAGYTAGLVSEAYHTSITRCVNRGNVHSKGAVTGGLVAYATNSGSNSDVITNCANYASVTSEDDNVGGLIGTIWHSYLTMTSCFNYGKVTTTKSDANIGYLVGSAENLTQGKFTYLYYDSDYECSANGVAVDAAAGGRYPSYIDSKAVTHQQMASGEVAYNLNQGVTDGTQAWYQRVEGSYLDDYPVLDRPTYTVYAQGSINCLGEAVNAAYNNTGAGEITNIGHVYDDNCICIYDRTHFKEPSKNDDGMYLIGTAGELAWVRDAVNAKTSAAWTNTDGGILLTADIDLSCLCSEKLGGWMPIGWSSSEYGRSWGADFDGQNHIIRGLYVTKDKGSTKVGGLFGTMHGKVAVKNVIIYGEINTYEGSGLLAYQIRGNNENYRITVDNVTVYGTNKTSDSSCGGLVYKTSYADFNNCHNYSAMPRARLAYDSSTSNGNYVRGGITARTSCSTFTGCSNHVDIDGTNFGYAGGIVGVCSQFSSNSNDIIAIKDCANYGNLSALTYVGSMVGHSGTAKTPVIVTRCLNTGNLRTLDGTSAAGIFGGKDSSLDVDSCVVKNTCAVLGINSTDGINYTSTLVTNDSIKIATHTNLLSGAIGRYLNASFHTYCHIWGQIARGTSYPIPYAHGGHMFTSPTSTYCLCSERKTPEPFVDEDGYYVITTIGELLWVRDTVNNGFLDLKARLDADINLALVCSESLGQSWDPIGNSTAHPFIGTFDGGGHTISGLYINAAGSAYKALFGCCGKIADGTYYGPTIKNLTVNGNVNGEYYCGLVAGYSTGATFTNLRTEGSVTMNDTSDGFVGGIVGLAKYFKEISDCTNYATVNAPNINSTSNAYAGGIAGRAEAPSPTVAAHITRCMNYGNVTARGLYAGGIAGYVRYDTRISYCGNVGDIIADKNVGGIVGLYYGSEPISNSYNYGNVTLHDTAVGSYYAIAGVSTTTRYFDQCYYNEAAFTGTNEETQVIAKPAFAFRSGEVAYLLGEPWGQEIDLDMTPVIDGMKLFHVLGSCVNYSNDGTSIDHNYLDGICDRCEKFEPAVLSEDEVTGEHFYTIANLGNLCWWRDNLYHNNAQFKKTNARQTADISLYEVCHATASGTPMNWEPINLCFNWDGTYDGQNHTISDLYINLEGTDIDNFPCGLFAALGVNGDYSVHSTIKNLTVEGNINNTSTIQNGLQGGSALIVAYNLFGNITNCHTSGFITSAGCYTGSICGYNRIGSITDCTNEADIEVTSASTTSTTYAGGIAGASNGQILRCINRGNVTASSKWYVGGIAGSCSVYVGTGFTEGLEDCANMGTITGMNVVGGICGCYGRANSDSNPDYVSLPMRRCWNSGVIVPTHENTGYLNITANRNGGAAIEDCYYNIDVATIDDESKLAPKGYDNWTVIPKTTAQFNSGEVAFLLGKPWGQNIDKEAPFDEYPVLNGYKVFAKEDGTGYTNFGSFGLLDVNSDTRISIADAAMAIRDEVDLNGDGEFNEEDILLIIDAILNPTE